jgi:DNA (cytosine-5)-methyltransferase 1
MKPRLLDLFCGAGGAAMGYHRAGFEVVGVDIKPQKHYPFEFIQADAMTLPFRMLGRRFDAIHASPPCQDHMRVGQHPVHGTGWLLNGIRQKLLKSGLPWVIENVPGAPMRGDIALCGCQVNLPIRRKRYFESNKSIFALSVSCSHDTPVVSVVGHGTPTWVREKLGFDPTIRDYRAAMGIEWMNRDELSQAIPPAYTEFIGKQLMEHIS